MEDDIYQIKEGVLFQKVDDESVLLEPETGNYFTLDPVGTYILDVMTSGVNLSEIVKQACSVYDVTQEQFKTDLEAIVKEMESLGLISKV